VYLLQKKHFVVFLGGLKTAICRRIGLLQPESICMVLQPD